MKRLIPAGILLALVILTYILSTTYITKSCNSTLDLIETAINEYKENKVAKERSKEIKKYWQKEEKILSFFVNHNHIDEVEQAISSMTVYSDQKDNILFYEYADRIKVLLHQIKEETKITTHSIFWCIIMQSKLTKVNIYDILFL